MITLLTQSSFLLCLNVIEFLLDHVIFCGLLGQVLLGIAFGAPGGNILSLEAQQVIVQLGYIGFILLVHEGGLSVSLESLKTNLWLSIGVAFTGIAVPIGLSFVLQPLLDATPLQAFAAGAALCSTSLGTIFTVLQASGLASTRLGAVLSTAAMIDDVVGLVMVQVVTNVGASTNTFEPVTVCRPIGVSFAFALLVPLVCRYIIRPLHTYLRKASSMERLRASLVNPEARFLLHSLILFGFTAAASYSGTSVLFTAYLCGVVISWWDHISLPTPDAVSLQPNDTVLNNLSKKSPPKGKKVSNPSSQVSSTVKSMSEGLSGVSIYRVYLMQPVNRILRPFFFVSILKIKYPSQLKVPIG
jgi:Kef-type K+ transport system membrane component KefB